MDVSAPATSGTEAEQANAQQSHRPLVGVLFTFPSRYLFTIGHQGVFRLGGWSPHVQTGFHESRLTVEARPELDDLGVDGRPWVPDRLDVELPELAISSPPAAGRGT